MILLIFGLILIDQLTSAALFGEQSSWSDNGKIVKVLSHDEQHPSNIKACSGSIVSPNLVLAATECIKFNNASLNKHLVLLNPERFPTNNKIYATAVENIDEWTLFKLEKTLKIEDLCPVNETRKTLMNVKLNIGVSNYRIHLRDLAANNKCFFYGFETNSEYLLKIMSMPPDEIKPEKYWGFTFTKDSQNPVLLDFNYFGGLRKAASPEFLMAMSLRQHFKAIENECGQKPAKIAFRILGKEKEFNKDEMERIENGLKKACDLLKVECIFI